MKHIYGLLLGLMLFTTLLMGIVGFIFLLENSFLFGCVVFFVVLIILLFFAYLLGMSIIDRKGNDA